ncbi:ATP-binding cassette domain-containing protein, partial [Klebsiella pneumoniae]|uniref:ATP-binding cassette domain-containing protein n=1 Tax=Klebsiella pneumoniae TaxID=573 RepID=UPI001BADF323
LPQLSAGLLVDSNRGISGFVVLIPTAAGVKCASAGLTLGIVGESGSGKSTLGLAILRLLESQGGIRFEGTRLDGLAQHDVRP